MPAFQYKARSARGDLIQGKLEATSLDAAAAQLQTEGNTPIDISEAGGAVTGIDIGELLARRQPPSLKDLILFSQQMYTLMKAGVPMVRAITGLIQSTHNARLSEALKEILTNIESGQNLSTAFGRHEEIFSTLYMSMIRIGEDTGRLDQAFLQISIYMARERETRERIKTALRYPTFVFIAIGAAIAVINIFVIPAFIKLFERSDVPLPWQTQALIGMSNFFVAWWPLMLGLLVAGIVGFVQYTKTGQGRLAWDGAKLKFPIIGDIILRATLARFARAFSMALSAGVPLIQGLEVVSRVVDNDYIGRHVLGMRSGIERGDSITRTATQTGMFTPLVLQMLAVGEETGAVDDMLLEVAEFYDREVDYDVENLSASIEPIIIVAIGIMVLMLALGVFLPMWEMASVVG